MMVAFMFVGIPPTPARPVIVSRTHNTATVTWTKVNCDGGHDIQYYNLRIGYNRPFFFFGPSYRYVYNLDASTSNYTFQSLNSRSTYYVGVQASGRDSTSSGYSSQVTFVTLSSRKIKMIIFGNNIYQMLYVFYKKLLFIKNIFF